MYTVEKYSPGNIQKVLKVLDDIDKYSIGMDEWFSRLTSLHSTETNYPPYNVIKTSNTETKLEVALAGFKKNEISVFTENNKLYIEGHKEPNSEKEYVHRGLATRTFSRAWTISDDVEVKSVTYEDGLLEILLTRVVPEHQKKKVWF